MSTHAAMRRPKPKPPAPPAPVLTPRQRHRHTQLAIAKTAQAHELLSEAAAHAKLAKRGRA